MSDLSKQYSELLDRIGTARLLNAPEEIKEALRITTDLETKVKLLGMIAKELGV